MWSERRLAGSLALAALLTVGLTACQDEESTADLRLDETPSSAPSPESSAATSSAEAEPAEGGSPSAPPAQGDVLPPGSTVHVGELPASGPEREAADAFVGYLEQRAQIFSTGELDLAAISSVATGDALQAVQSYLSELRERGHLAVGDSWVSVGKATVKGQDGNRTAALAACVDNATAEVDAQGTAVENPPPAYDLDVTVLEAGPATWVVSKFAAQPRNGAC